MLRIILIALSSLTIYSCGHRVFPDEKFIFSEKYRSFIMPYKVGDTLTFENKFGHSYTFVISKLDSVLDNTEGGFMNPRPSKTISISYWQPRLDTVQDFISLEIFPDNGEQSCYINIRNFVSRINYQNDNLITEPVIANGLAIDKYYQVENNWPVTNPQDIKTIYITKENGIIAWQDLDGNWWTRKK